MPVFEGINSHQRRIIMRIIITGGTGFIGRRLVAELAGAGYEVIVLTRNPARATGLPAGVRAERWDG
ncbi:MAG: NAD-dependent epimerase/dehydratase family protein, partial [Anaerolineae bacterium]